MSLVVAEKVRMTNTRTIKNKKEYFINEFWLKRNAVAANGKGVSASGGISFLVAALKLYRSIEIQKLIVVI